eukprot:TRINITY_DN5939_c0_g1_i1.p1 TRINITY_DN5939_c0_g1~~TRINITY_DN5939_c0_g1_i1.p1  ORF type:complete len:357 (-),score=65.06 TRINITY_DN5939_c0_g1_i1:23-1093(-)
MQRGLVGSEMCIRDRYQRRVHGKLNMEPLEDRNRKSYYAKLHHITNSTASKSSTSAPAPPIAPEVAPKTEPESPIEEEKKSTGDTVGEDEKVIDSYEHPSSEGFKINYIEKRGHDLRMKYLHSLMMKNILLPEFMKQKNHQTVVIFDWDDTLLCTSYLNPTGIMEDKPIITELTRAYLNELEPAVHKILSMAIQSGQTFIITNAAPGWVEHSCGIYFPTVLELLKKVQVTSARGEWEGKFPGNYEQWKVHAFLNVEKKLLSEAITNIVALGDSHVEMVAAHHLASRFKCAFIKTVKFRENPTPQELVKQLNLVIQKFPQISGNPKNLTIRLERKTPVTAKDSSHQQRKDEYLNHTN